MMNLYAVQETQKSADWLFRSIKENGITTVLAGLFILLVVVLLVGFAKNWIVSGEAYKVIVLQLNAANAIMQAQEESRTEKIERRVEALAEDVRDIGVKLDTITATLARLEARGGRSHVG